MWSKPLIRFGKMALYVVGRVPHGMLRLIDGYIRRHTLDAPLQAAGRFPWSSEVEALHPEIREEVQRMLRCMHNLPKVHELNPITHLHYDERDWRQVAIHSYGHWIGDHAALYPSVTKAFKAVPGLRLATVSLLKPGETIPRHAHTYAGFLIFHLGVVVPDGDCAIEIGGEHAQWEAGKVLVIDPTYPHEVWNNTDAWRVILLGEFDRPGMPRALYLLNRLYALLFTASPPGRRWLRLIRQSAARHRADVEAMLGQQ